MTTRRKYDERELLGALDTPQPPPKLKRRTLAGVSDALARKPQQISPDPWARIWFDWRWRLAWASAVIVLVVAHSVVPALQSSGDGAPDPQLVASSLSVSEVLTEIGEYSATRGAVMTVPVLHGAGQFRYLFMNDSDLNLFE